MTIQRTVGFDSPDGAGDQLQALLYFSRERRRSLAGIPKLFREIAYPIPSVISVLTSFPDRRSPVTFKTAIRIIPNGGVHQGLIFELGGATSGACAAWIDNDEIGFRAGEPGPTDFASGTYTTGTGELPPGLETELVFSCRPGDGRIRVWANGNEIIRAVSPQGQLPQGWAAGGQGAFAKAASGALPADVSQTGAPVGFEVIEPLSVYERQFPRQFV